MPGTTFGSLPGTTLPPLVRKKKIMDEHGNFAGLGEETKNITFKQVKLQRQENGHSWSIVGFLPKEDFRILGVLEDPIPHSFMVEFVKKVAEEFNAAFEEI